MNDEFSLWTILRKADNKHKIVGWYGLVLAVAYVPLGCSLEPHVQNVIATLGLVVQSSLTLVAIGIAGATILVTTGRRDLLTAMYNTNQIWAFVLQFFVAVLTWIAVSLTGLVIMVFDIHNTWLLAGLLCAFAHGMCQSVVLVLSLCRFGILVAKTADFGDM